MMQLHIQLCSDMPQLFCHAIAFHQTCKSSWCVDSDLHMPLVLLDSEMQQTCSGACDYFPFIYWYITMRLLRSVCLLPPQLHSAAPSPCLPSPRRQFRSCPRPLPEGRSMPLSQRHQARGPPYRRRARKIQMQAQALRIPTWRRTSPPTDHQSLVPILRGPAAQRRKSSPSTKRTWRHARPPTERQWRSGASNRPSR